MGQAITKEDCVDLAELPADVFAKICDETYTAVRTDGREEEGWMIQNESHISACGVGPWAKAHATNRHADRDGKKGWKFFMNNGFCCDPSDYGCDNGHTCRQHGCGWRSCDVSTGRCTFWPTRLKTPLEREAWWRWFDEQLNGLPTWSEVVAEGKPPPFKKEPEAATLHPATSI